MSSWSTPVQPVSQLSQSLKFLDDLQHNYNQLASEAKKKYPHVKEACETGMMRLRNLTSGTAEAAGLAELRAALIEESGHIMEPLFMACDTRLPKMVQISLAAIQRCIIVQCVGSEAAANLLTALWNLMEHRLEEVKVLQTVTLLITTNQLVQDQLLAKALALCFRLHYTKNSTTSNTASATIRQLVTVLFERVLAAAKISSGSEILHSKRFEKALDGSRYHPVQLDGVVLDAFQLCQDLIQIVNGEPPFWLKNATVPGTQISNIFGLELLELVIDQYPQTFYQYEEFGFLLKEKICPLVIKLLSPNAKPRSLNLSLNPLLQPSDTGPTSACTGGGGSPVWPVTVRLMRIVPVLIRNFFDMLVTESEIFLSLLVKSLEVDKLNWQRLIALEALYRMIHPKLLSSLCQHYDMKAHSSKILRDVVNALCVFIQSQFQVVDSSTTQSLIASLVNNNNSGHPHNASANHHQQHQQQQQLQQQSAQPVSHASGFPGFHLRGVSITLLFTPLDRQHRYKPFYIEQLDKAEPPAAPDGHGLSTAVACVLEIVQSLTKIFENDLKATVPTTGRIGLKPSTVRPETFQLHRHMLLATLHGLVGTFSLLLDASVEEAMTELLLERMRKLAIIYGLYEVAVGRDSLLICMGKSSLPSNYYPVPALSPENLDLEEPSPSGDDPVSGAAAALSLFSLSSVTNASINLPNLLSQQNSGSGAVTAAGAGAAQASKTTGGVSVGVEPNSTSSYEANTQIIAVGTPLPNNPPASNGNPSQPQPGPVMLTSKNLQCMHSIMHVAMAGAFVLEEKSWHIVFTTLQHMVWILGMKPSHLKHQREGAAASAATEFSPDAAPGNAGSSDLPVLSTMLSRLFECTHYHTISERLSLIFLNTPHMSNESLLTMVRALITLSQESMAVAYHNREPSMFAVVKLLETGLVNMERIDLIWEPITSHLIQVASHPYNKLRECGVEVFCNLVKSVLSFLYSSRRTEQRRGSTESFYLMAFRYLCQIEFADIRQKQLQCLLQILQANGEDMTDGWPTLLSIIEAACSPQHDKLVPLAFQCYELIVSNLLRYIPSIYLIDCINASVALGSQLQDLNVALSAVELVWNVADFLHSNETPIRESIERYAANGHKFVSVDLPFCENLTPMQSLWISLFKNLSNLCTDSRLSVRKSAVQTLMSTLSKHGQTLDCNTWKAIFLYVLFPLVDSVRTLCSMASNDKITHSESSKPNQYGDGGGPEYMIHYSRNTAFKQWCETQVSVLNGVSRILSAKLDMFVASAEPDAVLLNLWSLLFEFVYASCLSANSEVSMAAIKCFNEMVLFLSEFNKNRRQEVLGSLWNVVWKTWCNIGHHIQPNQHAALGEPSAASDPAPDPVFLPCQSFLCLLVSPLYMIFSNNVRQFTEADFQDMSYVLHNVLAVPLEAGGPEPGCGYHHHHHHHHHHHVPGGQSDQALSPLQNEVMSSLDRIRDQIVGNVATLGHLLPLMFHQYLALSLYAVNMVPPHLDQFIAAQLQHRFLPAGELTTPPATFKSTSFYLLGELALRNAFHLYQCTYTEPIVIKSHILHSMIKAYKIPLCFKYSCPLQSTWKYAVSYFIKTLELGLPLVRRYPNDFISIWADLALTFEGFLFPANKPPSAAAKLVVEDPQQQQQQQQMDDSFDVEVVELIRDHIMIHAQKIPKEFLLQIVSILNRGSIHSPSITSMELEVNRKLREDFARICFQTLLQFSFFGPKGSPELFIQSAKANGSDSEPSIGIVNKLAVASILKRFNDVIVKYVEDEQLCPCPLPRHRLSEISFVLKALATLIGSLKEAPPGVVEDHVWQQLIELYPKIVDCTMSNSPQVNNSIREVLHQYSCLLVAPTVDDQSTNGHNGSLL